MTRQAYWAISKHYAPKPIIKDETLGVRLEVITASTHLNDWEQGFLSSLNKCFNEKGGLTSKQSETLEKIEKKYSPKNLEKIAAWAEEYKNDSTLQQKFAISCDYYTRDYHGYFSHITIKWERDNNYVPTFAEYRKVADNKYSQRVVEATLCKPKYDVTNIVVATTKAPFKNWQTPDKIFLVLDNQSLKVKNAVKGGKRYKIADLNGGRITETDERYLKKPTKKFLKKLEEGKDD